MQIVITVNGVQGEGKTSTLYRALAALKTAGLAPEGATVEIETELHPSKQQRRARRDDPAAVPVGRERLTVNLPPGYDPGPIAAPQRAGEDDQEG